MFFAEGEEKEFPKEIRKEIDKLESKDKEIYYLNKERKKVDLEMVNFTINSLNLFLKNEKNFDDKQKNLMTEAIGNIPITFFILDKFKVDRKIEETIKQLIDIVDAHANLHIDRRELILNVLKNLEQLREV